MLRQSVFELQTSAFEYWALGFKLRPSSVELRFLGLGFPASGFGPNLYALGFGIGPLAFELCALGHKTLFLGFFCN
ncbi:hypothetical protein AXF42_Ash000608 [Apostasia shenzhenica]|uniref:Uncharacterized protein n=1 Tax=Apostasia shenzhenica TaxID=1088818 RepID=A0A2I0AGU0_9ASPA|nr:hypothetical protein AXF42_Ash000608 [Apostasia shenzhenica]